MSDSIESLVKASASIPGWICEAEATELAQATMALPENPIVVEIGVFMGRGTVLLAGARRIRGSGVVHCVDPFDCSGDAFSVPYYRSELSAFDGKSLEHVFTKNMSDQGLGDWIRIHSCSSREVASNWTTPVDLLLLDGDQSPEGARDAFTAWIPFLRPGGVIVLRNTRDRTYDPGHDGHRRLAVKELVPPCFKDVRQIGATTFAIRTDSPAPLFWKPA